MPDTEFQIALRDSVEEVLEKMFFVQPLPLPSEDTPENPAANATPAAGSGMTVHLTFEGSPSGALTLCISHAAARQIAADFLGADPDELSTSQTGEVVCELANMVCGSVLSRVESTATFRLAPPRFLAAEEWSHCRQVDRRRAIHAVGIGSGTLTALVETRDTLCPAAQESAS